MTDIYSCQKCGGTDGTTLAFTFACNACDPVQPRDQDPAAPMGQVCSTATADVDEYDMHCQWFGGLTAASAERLAVLDSLAAALTAVFAEKIPGTTVILTDLGPWLMLHLSNRMHAHPVYRVVRGTTLRGLLRAVRKQNFITLSAPYFSFRFTKDELETAVKGALRLSYETPTTDDTLRAYCARWREHNTVDHELAGPSLPKEAYEAFDALTRGKRKCALYGGVFWEINVAFYDVGVKADLVSCVEGYMVMVFGSEGREGPIHTEYTRSILRFVESCITCFDDEDDSDIAPIRFKARHAIYDALDRAIRGLQDMGTISW